MKVTTQLKDNPSQPELEFNMVPGAGIELRVQATDSERFSLLQLIFGVRNGVRKNHWFGGNGVHVQVTATI